jgi:hypothetical protein
MKKLTLLGAILLCTLVKTQAQSTNGLIAHWDFNGNTNDSYGTHHGTPNNVSLAPGKKGIPNTAYYFYDSMSFITVPYQSDLNVDSFTITAVLKVAKHNTDICQGNFILSRGHDFTPGHYGISFSDHGYNDCYTADTAKYTFYPLANNPPSVANLPNYQYSPNVVTNTWYCVSITYSPNITNIYVDGILRASNYPTGPIGSSTDGITIGRQHQYYQAWPFQFYGYLDDMKLYNRILTDSEIVNYCNGFIGDTTNNDTTNFIAEVNQPQINLYPNPNKGNFKIAGLANNNTKGTIQILNAVGQVIYADEVTPVNNYVDKEINLSGSIAPGIYIFQYKMADFTWTRRMVVKE